MKAQRTTTGREQACRVALVAFALIQLCLAGFMASSKERHLSASSEDLVDVEKTINQIHELNQKGLHQQAIDLLLSSLDKQPEDSLVRALLVQTFDLFLEQEIRDGQRAIAKNKQDINAYTRLAGALELSGDSFRAMEILLTALPENQKSVDVWSKIARLELKAGRDREALDVFREVIRLDSGNSDAINNAAYILARSPNSRSTELDEAYQLALKAHKLDKKNPQYLDTLAEVQFRKGNQKEAVDLIEEALKIAPEQESLRQQLSRFKVGSALVAE